MLSKGSSSLCSSSILTRETQENPLGKKGGAYKFHVVTNFKATLLVTRIHTDKYMDKRVGVSTLWQEKIPFSGFSFSLLNCKPWQKKVAFHFMSHCAFVVYSMMLPPWNKPVRTLFKVPGVLFHAILFEYLQFDHCRPTSWLSKSTNSHCSANVLF